MARADDGLVVGCVSLGVPCELMMPLATLAGEAPSGSCYVPEAARDSYRAVVREMCARNLVFLFRLCFIERDGWMRRRREMRDLRLICEAVHACQDMR